MSTFRSLITIIILYNLNPTGCNRLNSIEFKIDSVQKIITDGTKCIDIIDYFTTRIAVYNDEIRAIINVNPKSKQEAKYLDDYYSKNKGLKGKLHCIPIVVKDNINVEGLPTTCGIKALRHSIPNKDSTVVKLLKQQGAIIIAKTNLAEFANEERPESETGGLCRNPFDLSRSCGVSSTGSGAAISSAMGIIGLGTDVSGSIVYPSSFGGLFGLRTPLGNPDMTGILTSSEYQDTVGPISKYLDDLALAYSVMIDNELFIKDYQERIIPSKLRIGVVDDFIDKFQLKLSFGTFEYKLDEEIKNAIENSIKSLRETEIKLYKYSLHQEDIESLEEIIEGLARTECSSSCRKYSIDKYFNENESFANDSVYRDFNSLSNSPLLSNYWASIFNRSNVLNPKETCDDCLVKYFQNRNKANLLISKWFDGNQIDCLLIPTYTDLPYLNSEGRNDFPSIAILFTLSGLPILNVPIAYSKMSENNPNPLPIGISLVSRNESLLNTFKIAKLFEQQDNLVELPYLTPKIKLECEKSTSNSKIGHSILSLNILMFMLVYLGNWIL